MSISGNDIELVPVTPGESPGTGETPPDSIPENPPASETGGSQETPPASETGKPESPGQTGEQITTTLDSVLVQLDGISKEVSDRESVVQLADSLKDLVDVMKLEREEECEQAVASLPTATLPSGYEAYHYPVTATYYLYTDVASTYTSSVVQHDTAGDFEAVFNQYRQSVEDGTLAGYCVRYVYEITEVDGVSQYNLVYDSEKPVSGELPEEPEEPTDTEVAVLETLESINTELQAIRENDIVYREETLLLQQESRELYIQLVASNVVIGLILVVVLGYAVGHGFWQRMKVG